MERHSDPLRVLRAGWWILPVVLAAALGGAVYLEGSGQEAPVYRSEATLATVPDSFVTNKGQLLRSVQILEQRTIVSTLSRIPRSGTVRRRAARRLGTELRELAPYRVATRVLPGTHLIRVSVRGPEPRTASEFANALADAAAQEAGGYYGVYALRIMDTASPPGRPESEEERRSYAVAGVLGLFLGVGAAYGVGRLRLS